MSYTITPIPRKDFVESYSDHVYTAASIRKIQSQGGATSMGIEIQTTPAGVQPGGIATFSFVNHVQAYALGIMAFDLSFGPNVDHNIQDFSIKLFPGQT